MSALTREPERWGIIGGTGLDSLDALEIERVVAVDTPYGELSAPLTFARLAGTPVVFLPRHGEAHHLPPHKINYRANVWALAQCVERAVGVAAVGGITPDFSPRTVAVPDQIVDYTYGREHTFFDGDEVQHVDFSAPYCVDVRAALLQAAATAGVTVLSQGTYGATQGPRLESAGEINRMDRDGCDVVGMTGMPEAALAREAGLRYACCALVVNEAAGRGPAVITMDDIIAHLQAGMIQVKTLLKALS